MQFPEDATQYSLMGDLTLKVWYLDLDFPLISAILGACVIQSIVLYLQVSCVKSSGKIFIQRSFRTPFLIMRESLIYFAFTYSNLYSPMKEGPFPDWEKVVSIYFTPLLI